MFDTAKAYKDKVVNFVKENGEDLAYYGSLAGMTVATVAMCIGIVKGSNKFYAILLEDVAKNGVVLRPRKLTIIKK